MANEILSERRCNALILTFNRPEQANALNINMANLLFQALKPVTTDPSLRAVMLRGAGGNFMQGIDLGMYGKDVAAGAEQNNDLLLPYHSAIRELHAMDKPVLAVVTGKVSGAGLSLMLASDLVLAGQGAQFSTGFTSYAMSPDGGASFFLTRKVGSAKAAELLMLGEEFDAASAEKLSLVNHVYPDERLEEQAFAWIDHLSNGPTKAYGAVKRLVGKAFEQDINAHIGLEHAYWGACSRSFDFRSAIKATLAKQPAKYSGA